MTTILSVEIHVNDYNNQCKKCTFPFKDYDGKLHYNACAWDKAKTNKWCPTEVDDNLEYVVGSEKLGYCGTPEALTCENNNS